MTMWRWTNCNWGNNRDSVPSCRITMCVCALSLFLFFADKNSRRFTFNIYQILKQNTIVEHHAYIPYFTRSMFSARGTKFWIDDVCTVQSVQAMEGIKSIASYCCVHECSSGSHCHFSIIIFDMGMKRTSERINREKKIKKDRQIDSIKTAILLATIFFFIFFSLFRLARTHTNIAMPSIH